jgi:hypothetical protein
MKGVSRDLVTGLAHQIPSLLDVPLDEKGKTSTTTQPLLAKCISCK